jgi:exopolyphosphatase / guanosine-5'-triphosphate,3'-diphosphate pyrophosphatase
LGPAVSRRPCERGGDDGGAGNQAEFLARTSLALGTGIEIISGQEKARLIHLGVQRRWLHPRERFLIIGLWAGI